MARGLDGGLEAFNQYLGAQHGWEQSRGDSRRLMHQEQTPKGGGWLAAKQRVQRLTGRAPRVIEAFRGAYQWVQQFGRDREFHRVHLALQQHEHLRDAERRRMDALAEQVRTSPGRWGGWARKGEEAGGGTGCRSGMTSQSRPPS